MDCILTFKSQTYAIKAKRALEDRGIETSVQSLDPRLTKRGCAWGISFFCPLRGQIQELLSSKHIPYGTVLGDRRR